MMGSWSDSERYTQTAASSCKKAASQAANHMAAAPEQFEKPSTQSENQVVAPFAPAESAVCPVCPRACSLAEGQLGVCHARRTVAGEVIDGNYGRITSLALDPIEKKPLARFRPGSRILSVGSYGCNLRCPFCQNASIACAGPEDVPWRQMSPAELMELADSLRDQGNIGIAFTYNEPLVGYEYVRDTARLAQEQDLATVLVSNGYVNQGPLAELTPFISAANIDLKGFTQAFYDFVGGNLETVKHTIETLVQTPTCHIEVTTLVVPGINDSEEEVDAAARWLASLDPDIPYHLTRFFPCHRLQDRSPTPVDTIHRLAEIALRHLRYVYVGNC